MALYQLSYLFVQGCQLEALQTVNCRIARDQVYDTTWEAAEEGSPEGDATFLFQISSNELQGNWLNNYQENLEETTLTTLYIQLP